MKAEIEEISETEETDSEEDIYYEAGIVDWRYKTIMNLSLTV